MRDDSNNEFRTLLGFFLSRHGSFDSFLFDDVDDHAISNQSIGTGNGSTAQFQLARTMGGFVEPILAPNIVSSVAVAGVPKILGVDFTVGVWESAGPGIVTFASPPASGFRSARIR